MESREADGLTRKDDWTRRQYLTLFILNAVVLFITIVIGKCYGLTLASRLPHDFFTQAACCT